MLTRPEFCTHLALLAAGAAALPQQIQAFVRIYDVNTAPLGESGLIAVEDIMFGFGGVPSDITYSVQFRQGEKVIFQVALNRRASYRWVPTPQAPMLTTERDFNWRVTPHHIIPPVDDERNSAEDFEGTVRFVDQDSRIRVARIAGEFGRLADVQS